MAEAVEQRSLVDLIPDGLEWESVDISLFLLPDLACPAPSPAMLSSVKTSGVLVPILVVDRPGGYDVRAGRRRIKAARLAGRTSVPARVAPGLAFDLSAGYALTLVENAQRSSNPAAELDAIEGLVDAGLSEAQIVAATGMALPTVRKRSRLLTLPDALLEGLRSGAVSPSAAEAAVGVPPGVQKTLVWVLRETGRLTLASVTEARARSSGEARGALLSEIFAVEAGRPLRENDALVILDEVRRIDGLVFDGTLEPEAAVAALRRVVVGDMAWEG